MVKSSSTYGKAYYGWVVLASGFAIFAVGSAIQFSFGIFFKPLQDTFGWTRAMTSLAMTTHLMVFALSMVPVAWAIDRLGARTMFSIAAFLVGASLLLCSRITEAWQLYVLYGLPLAVAMSICGPVMFTIVTRWFTGKRGLALGIVGAGTGCGTLLGAAFSDSLIASYGWRNAYVIVGIVTSAILLVCAYFMRASPPAGNTGQTVNGASKKGQAQNQRPVSGMSFWQAVKTKQIVLIMIAQGFGSLTLRMVSVHIVPHATDVGISASVAALAIGTIGGAGILGRVLMGLAQDRIGARRAMIIGLVIEGMAMMALPLIGSDLLFFTFAVFFGFAYGGDVTQVPSITAQCFGLASIGAIYALVMTVGNVAGALGPIIGGYMFDLTGNYTIVFLGTAASLFVGVFCIWRLKLP
ncbi:MAG: MFS transporter [Dehalococcoidales bacterium]|nr:MFS transporter [Dehalococcoidales bacterium]